MLYERHKENDLTRFKVWNAVFSRRLPFTKLLVWQIALIVEFLEVLWLRPRRRPDLGGGGHLWHLQRPLLGNLLGGSTQVLALTHQTELFFRSRV